MWWNRDDFFLKQSMHVFTLFRTCFGFHYKYVNFYTSDTICWLKHPRGLVTDNFIILCFILCHQMPLIFYICYLSYLDEIRKIIPMNIVFIKMNITYHIPTVRPNPFLLQRGYLIYLKKHVNFIPVKLELTSWYWNDLKCLAFSLTFSSL